MVVVVTTALIMFQYANINRSGTSATAHLSGYLALTGSLIFDGMTGPRQDKLIGTYSISTGEIMFLVNLFAAPLCLLFSLGLEGTKPYQMLWHQWTDFIPKIVAFVICGAAGQVCVVQVLRKLGSLQLTLITTSRKFFAIILSVIWFRHSLNGAQWLSVALIFLSALLKYYAKTHKNKEF
eukprot:Gregarina_sp_Poly_1__6325@NODE_3364_length_1150_cov_108_083102_g521_i2_p1_GENE_NODE_3364_length_1150_cov_108_083102_g521_i2NODE_3364_length_1150_cov_108_083102_g521_i2_p1_ORF_typecomplete_len180_score14_47UAA/PF08449_11/7_1e36EamA/PF00892_20/5_7e12TPT/PF03151_16/9_6e10Nuc_sug_transp/PF04142_15/8_5e06SLC35F/PF06027_12/3_1e05PUNUT/PF16913_5/0_027Multi_Drug_Res/PF00893_19/0_067TraL/PF07178_11/2_1e03TraL/PF07178_11/0_73TraL/PF07178_11/1_9e02CRTlike/PF08627_10/26CRTlike/PF08627_10/1_6_NODE_3364_lengt